MRQQTLADGSFEKFRKKIRKELFLDDMEQIIPRQGNYPEKQLTSEVELSLNSVRVLLLSPVLQQQNGLTGDIGKKRFLHEQSGKEAVMNIPAEFTIGGVYMPPLLMASVLGVITAMIIARLLNTYRLSKYFFYPPLVFVAMAIIFTMIYGVLIIPF